ncbi:hypothetical protein [Polaribacter cellanae]|uniref:Alpha/beta hydrolase n=1 Tax=Polaribacter cellanae TaxID=2818493 RepID=A0A975CPR0_9FLAO|nr:hypothetical protein [Polaribacter cellanae]QTE23418.1 hypothetical protein J3359_03825 [Polaribacter cellanae]
MLFESNYKLMILKRLFLFTLLTIFSFLKSSAQNQKKYIYYLHGRIIEVQGKNAVSNVYGKYEFDNIIKALNNKTDSIIAVIRNNNVDHIEYAKKVSKQINRLVEKGVKPNNITVIGASKGAIIASYVATINKNYINYVLLAGNNNYQENNRNWKFHGQVLCIYEISDTIAGKNYDYWQNKENLTTKFEQIALKTNLGHGFLYKPINAWLKPTKKWIKNQKI